MTFSLVGRCERTGAVGAVIASASMAVAARCAAVRAGVGAVCSQSTTDPRLRAELLDAIEGGMGARDALANLVDRSADIAYRQLAVVDAVGGTASYSGELALGEATDVHAAGAAAAGNLLADNGVPAAMLAAFHDCAGDDLGTRLIASLQAGLTAGGEVTPVRSAGMVIAESAPWPVTDLRVDWHDDPVGQLTELWQIWQPQAASYISRALRPSEMAELYAAWRRGAGWQVGLTVDAVRVELVGRFRRWWQVLDSNQRRPSRWWGLPHPDSGGAFHRSGTAGPKALVHAN
jgi:uncharacterized Ntn-hydrolase superfamily protein